MGQKPGRSLGSGGVAAFSDKFDQVILLLSTGRTGTKALAHYFDKAFDTVYAVHEPPRSRHLRIASNRYLCGRLTRQRLVEVYTSARRGRLAQVREPIYMESNPFLHGFVDVFDEIFRAPRFVHIVRDPRTYVRSYLNFGAFKGAKGLAARYYPYWMLKPEKMNPGSPRRWRDMSGVEQLAWRWSTINAVLERGESLYGDRYLRVRFEDIFADDGSGLRRLAEWVGLQPTARFERLREQRVNASTGKQLPSFEHWGACDRQALIELCGPQMLRYGYALPAQTARANAAG